MAEQKKKKTNKTFAFIIGGLIILGLVYGGYKYIHSLSHEETEDAQVKSNMAPIIPHVDGYIKKVYVSDNDRVKEGDTLFVIEDQDYRVQLEQAKAALASAKSQLVVAKANIGSFEASAQASQAQTSSAATNIETAEIKLRRAKNDFERYKNLYENKSITEQQFEQAQAKRDQAQAHLKILKSRQKATASQEQAASSQTEISEKKVSVAKSQVESAKAQLEAAKNNLGYTKVTASMDGQLSSVDIQKGQFVSPGQSLFYLIDSNSKWVVANFKETQLSDMEIGQKVKIKVDAFPDMEFSGRLTAFSPATGARFSLLPPNNATGNFVKTVQRLPVRINFEGESSKKLDKLRSGMNVLVDVHLDSNKKKKE